MPLFQVFSICIHPILLPILKNDQIQLPHLFQLIYKAIQYQKFNKYLMKYFVPLYCFILLIESIAAKTFPKILWTYWSKDYSDDRMVKMFEENHRRVAKGWELRIVTDKNIEQYLNPIPYYSGDFFTLTSDRSVDVTHRSDFFRILVTSYYGGVYIDWTILLLDNFSWLQFEALRANPDVENKYGDEPDVLLFTCPYYGSEKTAYIKQLNQTFKLSPGYEIWFIAAKANNTFLRQYFLKYREGRLNNMINDTRTFDQISIDEKIDLKALYTSNYLAGLTVVQIWLQRLQREFDRVSEQKGQPRKLVTWHYKIWHINSERGPYSLHYATWSMPNTVQAQFFPRMSLEQMSKYLRANPKYFIKLPNQDRVVLQAYTTELSQVNISNFWRILHRTRYLIIQRFFCPQKYVIYEGSLLNQLMIKDSSVKDTYTLVKQAYKASDVDSKCASKMRMVKICVVVGVGSVVVAVMLAVVVSGLRVYKRYKNKNIKYKQVETGNRSQIQLQQIKQEEQLDK